MPWGQVVYYLGSSHGFVHGLRERQLSEAVEQGEGEGVGSPASAGAMADGLGVVVQGFGVAAI
jgi:hypothetical protein